MHKRIEIPYPYTVCCCCFLKSSLPFCLRRDCVVIPPLQTPPSPKKDVILKTQKAGDICKTHKVTRVTGPLPTKCKRLLGRGESRGVARNGAHLYTFLTDFPVYCTVSYCDSYSLARMIGWLGVPYHCA